MASVVLMIASSVYMVDGFDVGTVKSLEDVRRIAEEVKQESTQEELNILSTLLLERRDWDPQASDVLSQVLQRQHARRLQLGDGDPCMDLGEDECKATKDAHCNPCEWNMGCGSSSCWSYSTKEECCGNELNVPTGCYYADQGGFGSCVAMGDCSGMTRGLCPDDKMGGSKCDAGKAACDKLSAFCTYDDCGGCVNKGMQCDCSQEYSSCSSPGAGEFLFNLMTCHAVQCALCMKSGQDSNTIELSENKFTCDQMVAHHSGVCAKKCEDVAHCDAEAKCFLEKMVNQPECKAGGTSSAAASSCTPQDAPKTCEVPQSAAGLATTTAKPFVCEEFCDDMNKLCDSVSCGKPCAGEANSATDASMPATLFALASGLIATMA